MTERADFVKKIEDELRKPKDEQNQDLLAFWNGQLNALNTGKFDSHCFPSLTIIIILFIREREDGECWVETNEKH